MKTQVMYVVVQLALTLGLYFIFDLPLGYTALAVFVGLPVVGTLVTADDDLPGGWSNPEGTTPPPWVTARSWGLLSVGFSIAMLAFAIEAVMLRAESWSFIAAAIASAVVAGVLLNRGKSNVQLDS